MSADILRPNQQEVAYYFRETYIKIVLTFKMHYWKYIYKYGKALNKVYKKWKFQVISDYYITIVAALLACETEAL